jgi:hypothetical protein
MLRAIGQLLCLFLTHTLLAYWRGLLDGTTVTNYAQWRRPEAFEAMLRDREAAEHMGEAAKIAERFEPHLYEVSFVDEV